MEAQQRKKASHCCRVQHVFQEKYDRIHQTPEKLQWKGAKLNWKIARSPMICQCIFYKITPRCNSSTGKAWDVALTKDPQDQRGGPVKTLGCPWFQRWSFRITRKKLKFELELCSLILWEILAMDGEHYSLIIFNQRSFGTALLGPLLEAEGETLPSMLWGSAALDSCRNCTIDSKPQKPKDTLITYTWLWNIVKHSISHISSVFCWSLPFQS